MPCNAIWDTVVDRDATSTPVCAFSSWICKSREREPGGHDSLRQDFQQIAAVVGPQDRSARTGIGRFQAD